MNGRYGRCRGAPSAGDVAGHPHVHMELEDWGQHAQDMIARGDGAFSVTVAFSRTFSAAAAARDARSTS